HPPVTVDGSLPVQVLVIEERLEEKDLGIFRLPVLPLLQTTKGLGQPVLPEVTPSLGFQDQPGVGMVLVNEDLTKVSNSIHLAALRAEQNSFQGQVVVFTRGLFIMILKLLGIGKSANTARGPRGEQQGFRIVTPDFQAPAQVFQPLGVVVLFDTRT